MLVSILLVLTWGLQLRYPPLAYPHIGLIQLTVLAMLAVILPVRLLRSIYSSPAPRLHPAFLPGILFLAWVLVRWAVEGFPFMGASDMGTLLWAGCYVIIAYAITRSAETSDPAAPTLSISRILLTSLAFVGLACGIHATWQYFVSYAQAHQELLEQIGNRSPDRTELGLLYHLKLRRVASIFGDPNTLATFSAMAICASLELITSKGNAGYKPLKFLAIAAIPACLLAIFFSGSRGGLLDALLVFVIYGGYLLLNYKRSAQTAGTGIIILCFGLLLITSGQGPIARTNTEVPHTSLALSNVHESQEDISGWKWRSSTITERIHYLTVGTRMFRMAPVVGLGPGSVEQYFGRLKPPEARETKYLHNWVAQIGAELGLIGLALGMWYISSMILAISRARLWRVPADRALVFISGLLVIDGLVQVTWNQRELMSTFGLLTGVLMGRTTAQPTEIRERFPKAARLAICVIYVMLFALLETRYLAGKTAKYIATDSMAAGDMTAARIHWEKASLWTPNDPQPYSARATIAAAAGQLSSAKQLLEKALQLNPDSASLHVQAAEIARQLRQDSVASEHLTTALALYPSHPEYNYLMARHLFEIGNRQQALQYAQRAVDLSYIENDTPRYETLLKQLQDLTVAPD